MYAPAVDAYLGRLARSLKPELVELPEAKRHAGTPQAREEEGATILARLRPGEISPGAWWAVGGVVLLGTVGSYALNSWALARTSAATTAFFIYVQPLFAGALAFLVLGEQPSPRLVGAAPARRRARGPGATGGGGPAPPQTIWTAMARRTNALTWLIVAEPVSPSRRMTGPLKR